MPASRIVSRLGSGWWWGRGAAASPQGVGSIRPLHGPGWIAGIPVMRCQMVGGAIPIARLVSSWFTSHSLRRTTGRWDNGASQCMGRGTPL